MLKWYTAPEIKVFSGWSTGVQPGIPAYVTNSPDDGKHWVKLDENNNFFTPIWDVDTDAEVYWCIFNWQVDTVTTNGNMLLWYDGTASGAFNYVISMAMATGTPDKATNLEIYLVSGQDRTGTAKATLTQDFFAGTWYEIAIKITINTSPQIDIYIDWDEVAAADLTYSIDTGAGDPTPTDGQCCPSSIVDAAGKGDWTTGFGNCIVLDDQGSEFTSYVQIASGGTYNIVAAQVNCDVTNFDPYTPSTGNRNYRTQDEYYATNPPAGADMSPVTAGEIQLFGLAEITVGGSGTIDAVDFLAMKPATIRADIVLWVDGENQKVFSLAGVGDSLQGTSTTPVLTTPDGNDWTEQRLKDLFIGYKTLTTGSLVSEFTGILIFGQDLTKPADNPDSDNDDCPGPRLINHLIVSVPQAINRSGTY